MNEKAGEHFQRETRYTLENIGGHYLDWAGRPDTYKLYPDALLVALSSPFAGPPSAGPNDSLWQAIARRRSVRQFTDESLSLVELSRLLWASAAVTRVHDVPTGLYHYRVTAVDDRGCLDPGGGHVLEQLRVGGIGRELAQAALAQGLVARAAAVFVWTAVFPRSRWKYRERAYRYVYLDAGHIAAQLSLAAVALGLGSCQVGAFFDSVIDDLLGVDGESEAALYLTAVGHPAHG